MEPNRFEESDVKIGSLRLHLATDRAQFLYHWKELEVV